MVFIYVIFTVVSDSILRISNFPEGTLVFFLGDPNNFYFVEFDLHPVLADQFGLGPVYLETFYCHDCYWFEF